MSLRPLAPRRRALVSARPMALALARAWLTHAGPVRAAPPPVAPPPVHFRYGGAELDGPADTAAIQQAAALLKSDKRRMVVLLGFADPTGAAGANLELSHQRALVVQEQLVLLGVPADRVLVRGVGEQKVGGAPEDLRRVDFVFARKSFTGKAPDIDALLREMGVQTDASVAPVGVASGGDSAGSGAASIGASSGASSAKTASGAPDSAKAAGDDDPLQIMSTGLKEIDSVFTKVQGLLDTVRGARGGIQKAEGELYAAMGLAEGGTLTAALTKLKEDAKGNITVKMEAGKPKVSTKPGAPPSAAKGVAAVNGLVRSLVDATAKLASVPKQAQAIIGEAKALPGQLPTIAKNAGMGVKELPKLAKAVKHNIKLTASVPAECAAVAKQAATTFKSIGGAFGGGAAG